jgi:hypothetical protein
MQTSRAVFQQEITPIISAIFIVFTLFWMDEGYYDFRWMTNWGAWLVFIIYSGGLVLGEYIISLLLSDKFQGRRRLALVITTGIPLGVGIMVAAYFCFGSLLHLVV